MRCSGVIRRRVLLLELEALKVRDLLQLVGCQLRKHVELLVTQIFREHLVDYLAYMGKRLKSW